MTFLTFITNSKRVLKSNIYFYTLKINYATVKKNVIQTKKKIQTYDVIYKISYLKLFSYKVVKIFR